jgi:hypothetical protein
MYGVGLNPGFQEKEEKRKERRLERERKQRIESMNKSADL